ncbi:uncharacterized protein EAF01_005942 [Botrytis porri]|uniref:uncharacterized protein n=1 Tax=Botrytis porri TaxID=87229 RepID=UPI0018FFAD62|nr:uncharacterized protein EAF01_005942 [Botrytis porri]KAF7905421.1 hypothetical protein EAF01_005942 [Botrytis porri]
MSYSSEAYTCCFNGNVLETCQYCRGSQREPRCVPCNSTGVSHHPCPYHSSSANYYSNNLQTVPAHRNQQVRRSSGRSKNSHSGRTVG